MRQDFEFPLVFRAPLWLSALAVLAAAGILALQGTSVWLVVAGDEGTPPILDLIFIVIGIVMVVPFYFCLAVPYNLTTVSPQGIWLRRLFRKDEFIDIERVTGFYLRHTESTDSESFRAVIRLKDRPYAIPFAGADLRTSSIVRSWMGDTIERLDEWLQHLRIPKVSADDPRPIKRRKGARVLVVSGDAVLLMRDTDPGLPGSSWWVLPGGGLDEGEDASVGAARELWEETGFVAELTGPIATRVVTHGYSDRVLVQEEEFFRADVPRLRPSPKALTQGELSRGMEAKWVPSAELLNYNVWPAAISELLAATPEAPLDWGEVEESTVPLAVAKRGHQ